MDGRSERKFWKMHGLGNDFVVLDLNEGPAPSPELCRWIADRSRGVGCDLILGVGPPRTRDAVASFSIWTPTGEVSAQCGNGARCIALWLSVVGGVCGDEFLLESPSGSHAVTLVGGLVRVAMGRASVRRPEVIEIDGKEVEFQPVWLGNPHAVIVVPSTADVSINGIGTALQMEGSGYDPKVNVGLVEVRSRRELALRVFEFGAGETLACGSGACAAAVAMMEAGLVENTVEVVQRGGSLLIEVDDRGQICMAGPAALSFHGWLDWR